MKKIFTSIMLTAIVFAVFAQGQRYPQNGGPRQNNNYPQGTVYNQNSSLIINSASQRQIAVSVDNYQYQSNGNNGDINVGQLSAGNHTVVITEWKKNFWGKTVQRVVYNSSLYLKPGFETTIYINALGQVNVSERQLYNNGNYNNNNGDYGNNGKGVGNGYGRKKNKHKKDNCSNDRNYRDRRDRDDD